MAGIEPDPAMDFPRLNPAIQAGLARGLAIPACPLALDSRRRLDERYQRALIRYYVASGAGGLAVAVHTTQFAIRDSQHGLYEPVLRLAAEELQRQERSAGLARIAGVCGATPQAVREAEIAADCGYHAALLSLGAWRTEPESALIDHARAVAQTLPVVGFYLQRSVGGRPLSHAFWRGFAEIENVVAIKIAPFNRYQTLDVVRAVAESGRTDIALYTGNDDNIVADLLTAYGFEIGGRHLRFRMVGGLLGHWAVWTRRAVELHLECRRVMEAGGPIPLDLLERGQQVTDANAAFFDPAHGFAGCIAGLHEILRRQGLLPGIWCLDPGETLSPGQREEIDRVHRAYPGLNDDEFVALHLSEWLS